VGAEGPVEVPEHAGKAAAIDRFCIHQRELAREHSRLRPRSSGVHPIPGSGYSFSSCPESRTSSRARRRAACSCADAVSRSRCSTSGAGPSLAPRQRLLQGDVGRSCAPAA
jgi:hypothetical protein